LESEKKINWIFCYWDEPTWIKNENTEFYRGKEQQTTSGSSLPSVGESKDSQDGGFYKSFG
jgi:hypothetical protein